MALVFGLEPLAARSMEGDPVIQGHTQVRGEADRAARVRGEEEQKAAQ